MSETQLSIGYHKTKHNRVGGGAVSSDANLETEDIAFTILH